MNKCYRIPELRKIIEIVRNKHPDVGDFVMNSDPYDFIYSVKLSNEKKVDIPIEILQDFIRNGKISVNAIEQIYSSIKNIKKS